MDGDERPYAPEERDGAWIVTFEERETVAACGGERNAEQYAALLNQAWRRGFQAGYRSAKRA